MAKLLWEPSRTRVNQTNMLRFLNRINEKYGLALRSYEELYAWSTRHMARFWESMWEFAEIIASAPYARVVNDVSKMPGARWFEGAMLNFSENLLRCRDNRTALVSTSEAREPVRLTYAELADEVAALAHPLRRLGIEPGDRLVGFMPNIHHTVIAMLAATSIGATWSSCSKNLPELRD